MRSISLQRVLASIVVCFASLPFLLVLAAPTAAAGAPGGLAASACFLLTLSGETGEVGHGHQVIRVGELDGCSDSSCWSPYKGEAGEQKCAYGRSALLTLGRTKTPQQARQIVREEMGKGYRQQVRIGADLAAMIVTPKGGGIVMAVGRTTAVFALAAASDNDPSPTWKNVRPELTEDAEEIALVLRNPGCPVNRERCR
jgi:hypothetical protein